MTTTVPSSKIGEPQHVGLGSIAIKNRLRDMIERAIFECINEGLFDKEIKRNNKDEVIYI